MTDHGLRNYRKGCRCDVCRRANAERADWERYDAVRKPMRDDDIRHGTLNGYINLSCRCEKCRAANTYHRQQQRAGK